MEKKFWQMNQDEVFGILQTTSSGLTTQEAEKRIEKYGKNVVRPKGRSSRLALFTAQFKSPLILILVIAGVVTTFMDQYVETGVIFVTILINTLLGFWQEDKAESVIDHLLSYVRTRARVFRDGKEEEIDASLLVPGDIIRISQGDRVPADARILFTNDFEAEEAALTGESLPVVKTSGAISSDSIVDRRSMVFGGTLAVAGFCTAVVTATGQQMEFGKIAEMATSIRRESTPLQKSIREFSIISSLFLAVIIGVLFILGIAVNLPIYEMFLLSIAVAVSAVPESLPAALSVILAAGMRRLANQNVIVRKMISTETLGSVSVILTDKTGTLTEAKMKLDKVDTYSGVSEEECLRRGVIVSDVLVENPEEKPEKWSVSGRALEVSLVKEAGRVGILLPWLDKDIESLGRQPFSSVRKYSAIRYRDGGRVHSVIMGAPEYLLDMTALPDAEKNKILDRVSEKAFSGGRVLAILSREFGDNEGEEKSFSDYNDYVLNGILTFRDPLRESAKQAIKEIGLAGVRTVIMTGDHVGTAEFIARELGIINGTGKVCSGLVLQEMNKEELSEAVVSCSVFARVTPEQKMMIVNALVERGEVVAMTGDGVNDAPALERADVGVALGSGTDVAKSVSDIIILDDNFESIASAIYEGRGIIENLRKVIVYLLSDSLDELFLVGGSIIVGVVMPINALQILYINLVTDSLPAVAFAFEKSLDRRNQRRFVKGTLFDARTKFFIFFIGLGSSAFVFAIYLFLLRMGYEENVVRTFIFAFFSTYTLFVTFSLRNFDKSLLSYNPFSNMSLNGGVVVGFLLIITAVYNPFLQNILHTVALPLGWFIAVFILGLLNLVAIEMGKTVFRWGTSPSS